MQKGAKNKELLETCVCTCRKFPELLQLDQITGPCKACFHYKLILNYHPRSYRLEPSLIEGFLSMEPHLRL